MNFCPVCGKSIEGEFCEEHKQNNLKCKDIVLRICACKKYLHRGRWLPFQSLRSIAKKIASGSIKEKVKINPIIDEKLEKKTFEVEALHNGKKFILPAKMQIERCPVCSKKGTPYFESTLQLRPKNEALLDFVKIQIDKDRDVFVSDVVELKDGWNILLSSNKFALWIGRKLSKSFKGELKTSRHLFGFDKSKSKNLYRVTVFFRAE